MNVKPKQNDSFKNLLPYVVLAVVILVVISVLRIQGTTVNELSTGELITELKENNVTEIAITPKSDESVYYIEGKLEGYKETESFTAKVVASELENVLTLINENKIEEYNTNSDPGSSIFLYVLVNVLPLVLLVVVMYFLFMRLANSNKNSMDFGRSKERLSN